MTSDLTEFEPTIPFVDIAALDEAGKKTHARVGELFGWVPNSMLTYLQRPQIAQAIVGMIEAVFMTPTSVLPSSIKSKLGIICSSINGCAYCTAHQCSFGQKASILDPNKPGMTSEEVTRLISGEDLGSDPTERLCFEFARKTSQSPALVDEDLLTRMKAVMTPPQIVELASVVGLWKFYNTVHDSLHLPLEEHVAEYASYLDATARPDDKPRSVNAA